MGLRDKAKQDIEWITSNKNTGWALDITLTTPDGSKTATIQGISSKIHWAIDTEGNQVNSKKTHISFSEKFLVDAGYPVRNARQEVDLVNHRVTVADSSGVLKNFRMQNIFPNETIGLITCTLEDYE